MEWNLVESRRMRDGEGSQGYGVVAVVFKMGEETGRLLHRNLFVRMYIVANHSTRRW